MTEIAWILVGAVVLIGIVVIVVSRAARNGPRRTEGRTDDRRSDDGVLAASGFGLGVDAAAGDRDHDDFSGGGGDFGGGGADGSFDDSSSDAGDGGGSDGGGGDGGGGGGGD